MLKDDTEAARWYRMAAEQGHADAQFDLGVNYANGNEDARNNREALERDMSRAQISRATELAKACMASNYQDCGQQ